MTVNMYLEKYKNILLIKRMQPNTINTYINCLKQFLRFCYSIRTRPENLSDDILEKYLSETKSEALLRQRIGTIQNFYTHVLNIPYKLSHIPYPRRHKRNPEYFTLFELAKIFSVINNKKHIAMLKLQYACALRVHELVKIKKTDFIKKYDSHTQTFVYDLRIIGKGNHERIIPVPNETISEILNYINTLPKKPEKYLFEGQFKEFYSSSSVQIVLKKAMKQCNINKYGSTHILRHSRATHLIQNGVDIKAIKELLGHKSIKTTEIYTHLNTSDLRIIFSTADNFINQNIYQQKQLKSA